MHLERAGLLEVVADAERQRVEQVLAEAPRARCGAGRGAGQEEAAVRRAPGRRARSRCVVEAAPARRASAPARCARAATPRGRSRQVVFSRAQAQRCGRGPPPPRRSPRGSAAPRAPAAVLDDEAAAVEDEPVVARPPRWRRRACTGCPPRAWRASRAACRTTPDAERRGGDVHHQLRAGVACAGASGRRRSRCPRRPRRASVPKSKLEEEVAERHAAVLARPCPGSRARRCAPRRRRCRWAASPSAPARGSAPPATTAAQL